jgi:hypothetical protein
MNYERMYNSIGKRLEKYNGYDIGLLMALIMLLIAVIEIAIVEMII